jgi:hypothetical protein
MLTSVARIEESQVRHDGVDVEAPTKSWFVPHTQAKDVGDHVKTLKQLQLVSVFLLEAWMFWLQARQEGYPVTES